MLHRKVSVLGTQYRIYIENDRTDKMLLECDGYCDKTSKKIVVTAGTDRCNLDDFGIYQKKVMRHELVHAFLFESGLHENFEHSAGHDETLVDWIAAQFPKMLKAFQQAGCLE